MSDTKHLRDAALYSLIPKTMKRDDDVYHVRDFMGRKRRRTSVPPAAPRYFITFYTCMPQMGYCSAAEKGIRCRNADCVDRGRYHDPGDEDAQA